MIDAERLARCARLIEQAAEVAQRDLPPSSSMSPAGLFAGWHIVVSPDTPKFKLSADVPVTPEFRADFDAWALRFFGFTNLIDDDRVIFAKEEHTIYVSPRLYARLQRQFPSLHSLPQVGAQL